MIKYFFYIIIFYFSYQLFTSCASPGSLTGGPRDTIPPIRLYSNPEHKTTNYTGKTILMEYDERIKTAKIKDQLIITPLIQSKYEYTIKKNTIKLTFEDSFLDSTTYTLNFRESIQDITESNPTKDNKFTFSTGSYIDSMSITGYVKELLTYDTLLQVTVGLFKAKDTINIFNGSPYYFTELEDDGSFLIENIKNGRYLLYAFKDANKNLTLETNMETYGFLKDTITLDTGMISKSIDLIRLDLTKFKILTALPSGQYFDINFNKYITDYSVSTIDSKHPIRTNLAKENKSIRFYNNFMDIDSLQISFTAKDSILTEISDTLYVKFSNSKRKKEEFTMGIEPTHNSSIETKLDIDIKFNKPIVSVNTDSLFIQFDTTKIASIHDSIFVWNKTKDQLNFQIEIDKSKADTILNRRNRNKQALKDSIQAEQENTQVKKQITKNKNDAPPKINTGLQLFIGTGTFFTADNDTSKTIAYNYKFIIPEDYGIQQIKIQTQHESFFLQLVTEKFEVIREIKNQKAFTIKNLKPGKYKIRVLIDANNDGIWSPGNMQKQIEPEPVYIYPELLIIRADWETNLDLTF